MMILVVEPENNLRHTQQDFLQRASYVVDVAPTLAAARARLAACPHQFVLLAQVLPDGDGLAWLRQVTQRGDQLASFILLTATAAAEDRLHRFAAGADDCLHRAVPLVELERRLRSIARQRRGPVRPAITLGAGFVLDLAARALRHGAYSVNLSRSQFDLLHYLLRHRGRPLTRQQLGAHIGKDSEDSNFIDVHIMNMRKALARFAPPDFLQTVWGVGYRVA